MQLNSKDFSFVGEGLTAEVYQIFASIKFKPNLTQTAAISLLCVVDDHAEKVEQLALRAAGHFDVLVTRDLSLLTIRHYTEDLIHKLVGNHKVLLKQQTGETVQLVMKR